MASFSYKTSGVCSREIHFDINNNIVSNVRFVMGCNGNTQGVAALCEGLSVDEVIKKLQALTAAEEELPVPTNSQKLFSEQKKICKKSSAAKRRLNFFMPIYFRSPVF